MTALALEELLNALKVTVLKQLCKRQGQSQSGRKSDLVERLVGGDVQDIVRLLGELTADEPADPKLELLLQKVHAAAAEELADTAEDRNPAPSPEKSSSASNELESKEPEPAKPRRARHAYQKVEVTGCDGLATKACLTFEDPCDHDGKVGKYCLIARSQQDGTPTFELQIGPGSMFQATDALLDDNRLRCGKLFEPQTGFQQLLKFESEDEFEAFQQDFVLRTRLMALAHRVAKLRSKSDEASAKSQEDSRRGIPLGVLSHTASFLAGLACLALARFVSEGPNLFLNVQIFQ
eukprot:TRINITY_DN28730_c0_g1_i1.p1 TRINITY_DN28730_c0_g1~~TRINITY_DN28730_c0_g1_i1.p1  ORF type:complete len:293 (+),score=66.10 TRINITY_DN28730_c0_g1_i1:72-950(+)